MCASNVGSKESLEAWFVMRPGGPHCLTPAVQPSLPQPPSAIESAEFDRRQFRAFIAGRIGTFALSRWVTNRHLSTGTIVWPGGWTKAFLVANSRARTTKFGIVLWGQVGHQARFHSGLFHRHVDAQVADAWALAAVCDQIRAGKQDRRNRVATVDQHFQARSTRINLKTSIISGTAAAVSIVATVGQRYNWDLKRRLRPFVSSVAGTTDTGLMPCGSNGIAPRSGFDV